MINSPIPMYIIPKSPAGIETAKKTYPIKTAFVGNTFPLL
jgi:hypothetical protein